VSSFLPDTSCLVAAVVRPHPHHQQAVAELARRLARAERLVLAAPTLGEAYSVLTRSPGFLRYSGVDALELLRANFVERAEIVALTADEYWATLRSAPAEQVLGGRIYDRLIAACAAKAGVSALLTFNADHFAPFAALGFGVVVPTSAEPPA
jgi:predicted nucleic acid-binding protein